MFAHGSCPMCGSKGKPMQIGENKTEIADAKNCGSCGTVFNNFGVILSLDENEEHEMTFN